eukprot:TRINITY_DN25137_c1_g1_i2.p1 TRINITY_DN25137_c1_g1~~TRINITY_DN25137_c1_g1_i2.p1  ORF type:complete len:810 (+),score=205.93 TRINITY_DN25137_c1_g1_i2:117-2546(+)
MAGPMTKANKRAGSQPPEQARGKAKKQGKKAKKTIGGGTASERALAAAQAAREAKAKAAAEDPAAQAAAPAEAARGSKRRSAARPPAADEDDLPGGTGGLESLLRLRSLLAPPGTHMATAADGGATASSAAVVAASAEAGGDAAKEEEAEAEADDEPAAETAETKAAAAAATAAPASSSAAPAAEPLPEGPDWTSRYHVVDATGMPTPLEELEDPLHPVMERSLRKAGFAALFPVQAAVIPMLLRGSATAFDASSPYSCDVCIAAPTGQGKTLAYAVPIVQSLLGRIRARPRALVLLPTRDLALQVFRVFERLRDGLGKGVAPICAHCLIGQRSFAEEQRALQSRPADVIVCTPGRLNDHYLGREGTLDLSGLRWFVADEADRLLATPSHRWLEILERVCAPRATANNLQRRSAPQKLLLSATMTWNPQKLAMLKLNRAMFFISSRTGQHTTPKELRQRYTLCKVEAKPLAVLHLLQAAATGKLEPNHSQKAVAQSGTTPCRVVVFCASVDTAHRLARLLQLCALLRGEKSEMEPDAIAEFSSTLTQPERTSLLSRFRRGKVNCLVCSDVVARGIDIPEVLAVINYSPPEHLSTYIHRVGRTARAGRIGHTFTILQKKVLPRFEAMLRESADCWERVREYELPADAHETDQDWYSQGLAMLERCLALEGKGQLPPSRALTPEQLQELRASVQDVPGTSSPSAAAAVDENENGAQEDDADNGEESSADEEAESDAEAAKPGSSKKAKKRLQKAAEEVAPSKRRRQRRRSGDAADAESAPPVAEKAASAPAKKEAVKPASLLDFFQASFRR